MQRPESSEAQFEVWRTSPLWLRGSAFLLFAAAIALFVVVVGIRSAQLSSALLVAILVALSSAATLQIPYLLEERRRHRETARAFYATDREFRSIFEHALDGILILDDHGICLDTNSAALALLGVPRAGLVGHAIAKFYADRQGFDRDWDAFLRQKYQRGQAELVRGDQAALSVSYAAAANYVPGRHVVILCDTTGRKRAESFLRASQERFQQMADHIEEIFWMMNAETKALVYVNQAYEMVTGRTVQSLYDHPSSYEDVIHPGDRVQVLAKLEEAVHTGKFDQEFRILRQDGALRWVWVKASPIRDTMRIVRWLVGTVQDVTTRKLAEAQVASHLAAAEAARAEAEALRKSTLALTQNLSMDTVLDTLLKTLFEIVPYDSACVILKEADSRLYVEREAPALPEKDTVLVLDANENVFLQRALVERKSVFLADTAEESDWTEIKALAHVRCWLCVPLLATDHVFGLLSVGSMRPRTFTPEHYRVTKSLAISAAVAIQNARLYEQSEIYAGELEQLLKRADQPAKG
jgi:PAS domain S-box-containing protein